MKVNKGFATLAALCASVFVVGTSEYLIAGLLPQVGIGLMLLFAAGSAMSAVAPSFGLLLVGRVVSSLGHAAFLALAMVTATRVVPAETTGSAIATVASGFTVATLLGVPLGHCSGRAPDVGPRSPR